MNTSYQCHLCQLSINSANIVTLMKLSPSSVASYLSNLREFTIFSSDSDRNFTFTPTNFIGLISFMTFTIELILCFSFFAKATVFGLIVANLVNRNYFSLSLIMLVITHLLDSLLSFCNLLCLSGEKQTPRMAVVSIWNISNANILPIKKQLKHKIRTFVVIGLNFFPSELNQ